MILDTLARDLAMTEADQALRPISRLFQHSCFGIVVFLLGLAVVHWDTMTMARDGRTLFIATLACAVLLMPSAQASDRLTEHTLQLPAALQASKGKGLPERVSGYFRLDRQ